MNLEKQNKSDDDIKKNKFTANNRYFTICIYTMFVIFFGAIIINLITSWNTTLKNIEKGLTVLMPFIIGALIAYILNPAVARFYKLFRDKCKIKSDALCKILAIITAYVLVIGIIVIVLFGVIPQIITSLTDLVNFIPTAAQQLYHFFDTLEERFPSLDTEVLRNTINNAIPNFINYAKDFAANMIPALYSISMSILKWVLNLFIAIMVSIYMLADKRPLVNSCKAVVYAFVPVYSADPGSFCRSQSSIQQFYRRKGDRLYDHRSALFCTDADPETSLCRADQRNRRNHKHDPLFWSIHRCHSKCDHPAFYQSAQSRDLCCHGICITAV